MKPQVQEEEGKKVVQLESKFGTIYIHPPEKPATEDDETRLYRVLLECLTERKKGN